MLFLISRFYWDCLYCIIESINLLILLRCLLLGHRYHPRWHRILSSLSCPGKVCQFLPKIGWRSRYYCKVLKGNWQRRQWRKKGVTNSALARDLRGQRYRIAPDLQKTTLKGVRTEEEPKVSATIFFFLSLWVEEISFSCWRKIRILNWFITGT